jgi:antitoxin component of MazEF toxin-antitoxin module
MRKKIKKWGNSLVIVFTKEEQEIFGLVEGDIINLEEMIFQKVKKEIKPKTLAGEKYTANKVVKEVLDNSIKVTKVKEIKK